MKVVAQHGRCSSAETMERLHIEQSGLGRGGEETAAKLENPFGIIRGRSVETLTAVGNAPAMSSRRVRGNCSHPSANNWQMVPRSAVRSITAHALCNDFRHTGVAA